MKLQQFALNEPSIGLIERLRTNITEMSAREMKRIHHVERLTNVRLNATHPPVFYLVESIRRRSFCEPQVVFSPTESEQLESELTQERGIERELRACFKNG
jgi:hypothetical protein